MVLIVTAPSLEECRWAIADHAAALPRAREPLRLRIGRLLDGAIAEREKAHLLVRSQWGWLDAHREHIHYDEGETVALESLAAYEQWCDVVREMCRTLGDDRERCVG